MPVPLRALRRSLVAALLFSAIVYPAVANAEGSTSITPGVVGYGTVHVDTTAANPPDDCTSAQSNPGGTNGNVNAGTEHDCSAFTGGSFDHCTTPTSDGSYSCSITLEAQNADSGGWRFDHWSGSCSGTSTSCTLATSDTECDPNAKPPCHTTALGPFTAVAHFVDTRAPTTTYSQAPTANSVVYSDTQSQTFTWSTNEDGENPVFACKKDAGTFSACSSGVTWSSISDGIHDFCVHGTDASGLQGTDACRHWEQETNPTAAILTHPASVSTSSNPSFTYNSNKSSHPADGSTLSYDCKLDGGAFAPCPAAGKAYSSLSDGSHTFQVEAVFTGALGGGAHTSAAASYTWTQDTTGPDISLSTSPGGTVNINDTGSTSISWTAETGATFTCKLDDDPSGFQPCTSAVNLNGLADGIHDFYIRATDSHGNAGPVKDVHWDQETTPSAAFTGGPSDGSTVGSKSSTFSFSSPNANATFECSLDGGAYVACPSPYGVTVASDGSHALSVRATFTSALNSLKYTGIAVSRTWTVSTSGSGSVGSGGASGTSPRLAAPSIGASWKRAKHFKKLSSLNVLNVPAGATVTIACKGKKGACPFKRKVIHVKSGTSKLALGRLFKRAKLPKGTVVDVKITKPGMKTVERKLKA